MFDENLISITYRDENYLLEKNPGVSVIFGSTVELANIIRLYQQLGEDAVRRNQWEQAEHYISVANQLDDCRDRLVNDLAKNLPFEVSEEELKNGKPV